MTQLQWQTLESIVAEMTADDKQRLAALLATAPPVGAPGDDPLLGAMADEPELLDRVMESVYHAREHHPLRIEE